jgi:hypothetical protein
MRMDLNSVLHGYTGEIVLKAKYILVNISSSFAVA